MGQITLQDEGDRLEPAMWMRAEGQAVIARPIELRTMVVEEQEGVHLVDAGPGNRAPGRQVGDVVTISRMLGGNGACGHEIYSWEWSPAAANLAA